MYKESTNGTVANSNNATITAIEVEIRKKSTDKPKRNYKKEAVYDVLDRAMRQFKRQITQNNETKRECIVANVRNCYDDALRFWLDFNREVEKFTDSIRFNEYCKAKGHDVLQVAEHIIAEGKTFKNKVLSEGYHVIEQMAYMFNGNLFVDTERIYDKPKN
jgi:hypothetical protein